MINQLKEFVRPLDEKYLGGAILHGFRKTMRRVDAVWLEPRLRRYRNDFFRHAFHIEYPRHAESLLNKLCDKYGTDKGETTLHGHPYNWASHNYTDFYEFLFRLRRHDVRLVVECGMGTNNTNLIGNMGVDGRPGASLRMWRDYFPKAQIIGVDVDGDILFREQRIKTFQCDQTSQESIASFIKAAMLKKGSVDIIIDDGLHESHAGIAFFEGVNHLLADDGYHIIEDVLPKDYKDYKDYFAKSAKGFTAHFVNFARPNHRIGSTRLIIITPNSS